MPIYEFRCKTCEHDFKTLRRADRVDETTCPACGDDRLMRLLSVTAQVSSTPDVAQGGCSLPECVSGACMRNPSFCGCQ